MTAVERKQTLGGGSLLRKARDGVGHFGCRLAVDDRRALNANRLGEAGPVKMPD
jgi:hypothetical protein